MYLSNIGYLIIYVVENSPLLLDSHYKNYFSYFSERIFPYHPVACPTCGEVMQAICSDLQCIIVTMKGLIFLAY